MVKGDFAAAVQSSSLFLGSPVEPQFCWKEKSLAAGGLAGRRMLRDCLQESKVPVVLAQSGSSQQLGKIFFHLPRCQQVWVGILHGLGIRNREGCCQEAPRAERQYGRGRDPLAEPLQRITAPALLPLCCSRSIAASPETGLLQPVRRISGCFGHLTLPSLP